jgi:peroxiredoxin
MSCFLTQFRNPQLRAILFAVPAFLIFTGSLFGGSVEKPAPAFQLQDLRGGSSSLALYQGKTVLLNFWATWCVPCLQEIPELIRLQESIEGPFTIIGIAVASGSREDVKNFVDEHGINYSILLDPEQKVYRDYRLIGLPASFLLDPRGRIMKTYIGPQTYESLLKDVQRVVKN